MAPQTMAFRSRFIRILSVGIAFALSSVFVSNCGQAGQTPQPSPTSTRIVQSPGTHDHLIIFLHGINQDASIMGTQQNYPKDDVFVPILTKLRGVYIPSGIHIFQYQDDLAFHNSCHSTSTPTHECISQSSVNENATALALLIHQLHDPKGKKVTLISYSMGGSIIRTVLAGCPTADQAAILTCPEVAAMLDNVFFINTVHQGSWLMAVKHGLDTSENPVALALSWATYAVAKQTMGLDTTFPAERDLTPNSDNIQKHNRQPLPTGIHYFNFFGDIQVRAIGNILGWQIQPLSGIPFGDLVLLPGKDDAQALPAAGGARLCPSCGDSATFIFKQDGSSTYSEWPLTDHQDWHYTDNLDQYLANLGGNITASQGKNILSNIGTAPEAHMNIYTDPSLENANTIGVSDNTGRGGTTSIANEILWQLEKADGI
jgi:pimeloyl-ACP methyl ester carboxylesterase